VVVERAEIYAQALAKRHKWLDSPNKEDLVEPENPGEQYPMFTADQIIPHVPQHDAESIFWLLWFSLARANPVSPVREATEDEMGAYTDYCEAIFNQQFGSTFDSDSRSKLQFMHHRFHYTLDPSLSHLETMLNLMWSFLKCSTIVWQRYNASPYHAHALMKGLLLVEILRLSGTDGIPLDTSCPRRASDPPSRPACPPETCSFIEPALSEHFEDILQGSTDVALDIEPPKKRRKLGHAIVGIADGV
jgi:hypothetical protein